MAQFEHALDASGAVVSVGDLDESRRRDAFTCPDCRSRLFLSWKNDIKERHFRHDAGLACNGETDIHLRLKYAFADAFHHARSHGLPFGAEIEQRRTCVNGCCQKDSEWARSDLARFDDVQIEFRLSHQGQDFIPDCYLTDSTGDHPPLFFEVRVTSKNSDAKLASGRPILEMIVREKGALPHGEREERCLEAIRALSLPRELIQWHNFALPTRRGGPCLANQHMRQAPAPPVPQRVPQYTYTGVSLSPPKTYQGEGANGRTLVTLTWFPWNGTRVLWDTVARRYLVIQGGVDHGEFPNHGLAYEFCQSLRDGGP